MDVVPYSPTLLERWAATISVCRPISEWTGDREIAWLCEQSQKCSRIVEVGSYKGKSAKAFASNPSVRIYCVDRFQDNTEPEFRRNLAQEIKKGQVRLFPMESGEASIILLNEPQFDMAFIDGSHEEADVSRDILLWEDAVRTGGIMLFHDCYPNQNNDVHRAIKHHRPDYRMAVDSLAYYIK